MSGVGEIAVLPYGTLPGIWTAKGKGREVPEALDIIDIRRVEVETNIKADILSQFNPADGPRRLPTLLLYDERGLQLFEKVGCSA